MQHIPEGSKLVAAASGVVTARPGADQVGGHEGKRALVELYEGQKSLGYHSDYKPVMARWLRVTVYNGKVVDGRAEGTRRVFRFTGARFAEARKQFDEALSRLAQREDHPADAGARR